MGSLAGVFNACSTLFTVDLYEKWRPGSSQHQIVRVGRMATAAMIVVALAWIPVIKGASGLYTYLQAVQGYLAPPIFIVFFFGVFFKRLNAQGALWAMIVGFALGIFRMFVDTPVALGLGGLRNGYTPGSFLWIINNINFQYFSVLITIVSAVVMVGVSHMTAEPDYGRIRTLRLRRHRRRQSQHPGELEMERSGRIGSRTGLHSGRVFVLQGVGHRFIVGYAGAGVLIRPILWANCGRIEVV